MEWRRLLLTLLLAAAAACEKERRVPYIPADVARWERPYRGSGQVSLEALDLGTLEVPAALRAADSFTNTRKLSLFAFVISHRRKGLVVFDPGPSRALYGGSTERHSTKGLLEFRAAPGGDLEARMRAAKIGPEKIVMVLVSSSHFYRAGGAAGFEGTELATTAEERRAAAGGSLLGLYRLEELEGVERWRFLKLLPASPYGTFAAHLDLFGDGSLVVLPTPGYTAGGISLFVRLASRPVLLLGDFAWSEDNLRYARIPPVSTDPDRWWDTVWRVKRFADLAPELVVVPGTGSQALEELARSASDFRLRRATNPGAHGS